jgi:ABC-type nickel/cobalt efflux system permease component RcnA
MAIDLALPLGIALLLGLRHACDPDHLVAVTSLIAAKDGDARAAAGLGAWWGLGHAAVLVLAGAPLIALETSVPPALEAGAEKAVALLILVLAGRVVWKWARGNFRAGLHRHQAAGRHRHLRRGEVHRHESLRSPGQAFGIGLVHGLAGTGAVILYRRTLVPALGAFGVLFAAWYGVIG